MCKVRLSHTPEQREVEPGAIESRDRLCNRFHMAKDFHIPSSKTAAGSQPSLMALEEAACRIEPPVKIGSTSHLVMIRGILPRRIDTALPDGAASHTIPMVEV